MECGSDGGVVRGFCPCQSAALASCTTLTFWNTEQMPSAFVGNTA